MFDPITNRYLFRCPSTGNNIKVPVSEFRVIRRLRGATQPAVFRVLWHCTCGDKHESLVTHDALDWQPLIYDVPDTFVDLMTGRTDLLSAELEDHAMRHLCNGDWPWVFWCHPESSPQPGYPSKLRVVTPERDATGRIGVLVRCASCDRHTVNFVSRDHLDVPFHNDQAIGYLAHLMDGETVSDEESFRHEISIWSHRQVWGEL